MSEPSYDLLFKGEFLPDADPEQVRASLARLLKLDAAQLEQMFSGRTTVLRRATDRDNAARFQQAFKQAGARLRVVPAGAAEGAAQPGLVADSRVSASAPAAPSPPIAAPAPRKASLAERLAAQAAEEAPVGSTLVDGTVAWRTSKVPKIKPPESSPVASQEDAALRLAPLGADMLSAQERAQAARPPVQVDISQLSVAPSVGNLPTLSRAGAPTPPPVIPDLSVSPPGADLGERRDFVELALDLSHLSLAELGARVGPQRQEVVADIDLSGLSLAPQGSPARP